jgi:hypothetical protein
LALEDFSDGEMYEILQLYLEQVPGDEDFQKLFSNTSYLTRERNNGNSTELPISLH